MTKLSVLISSLLLASSASATLWPIPAHYEQGDNPIWLSPDVKLEFGKGSYSGGSKACEPTSLTAPGLVSEGIESPCPSSLHSFPGFGIP
jgi:hypothetical protein